MKVKKQETVKPHSHNERVLSLFDVDARSELRSIPFSSLWFPLRVGEQIELRADVEHGGGSYLVVGVRHILQDASTDAKWSAAVVGVVVDVKPQHSSEFLEADATAAFLSGEDLTTAVIPLELEPEPE